MIVVGRSQDVPLSCFSIFNMISGLLYSIEDMAILPFFINSLCNDHK